MRKVHTDEPKYATYSRVKVLEVLREFCEHGIESTAGATRMPVSMMDR